MQFEKIFKWLIILFLVYSLFNAPGAKDKVMSGFNSAQSAISLTKTPIDIKEEEKFEGTFLEKYLSNVAVNVLKTPEGRAFFENLVTPMVIGSHGEDGAINVINHNLLSDLFKISTKSEGSGSVACCGHFVQFSYETTDMQNFIIDARQTKIAQLGKREVIPALENIITGMKVGEVRTAISAGEYAYDSKKFQKDTLRFGQPIKIEVKLLDVKPNFVINQDEVKIFDDMVAYQIPLLCGDIVKFRVKISKFNGEIVFDSNEEFKGKKIEMRIGDNTFPAIFGYALHGKIPVGKRAVISPGKYFTGMFSKDINKIFSGKYKLPSENEYFLTEFYDIDSGRKAGVPRLE